MMMTVRDHKMNWQPAGAVCGLDLRLLVTGMFGGKADRNWATVQISTTVESAAVQGRYRQ